MNVGKTLFAQVMEFVPWKTFGRIIERHKGDAGVRTLDCADLFRVMAFAQLTWRESLRDIEACLAANQAKLFHMGLKAPPARSTLADALNLRDWRIYHALAQRLIARARALYTQEPSVLELDASVYVEEEDVPCLARLEDDRSVEVLADGRDAVDLADRRELVDDGHAAPAPGQLGGDAVRARPDVENSGAGRDLGEGKGVAGGVAELEVVVPVRPADGVEAPLVEEPGAVGRAT
jgi:hypothetical protein